jgi:hypothetical protein
MPGCERLLAGAVAVANSYGFLLKRLTLTTASPFENAARGSRVHSDFPDMSVKLVRLCEITRNRRRCKNILNILGKIF